MITLAHVVFRSDVAPSSLLWTLDGDVDHAPVIEDGAMTLPEGSMLSLDTYYNSFFERYWRRYTDIKHLAFAAEVTGCVHLSLVRVNGFGDQSVLQDVVTKGGPVQLEVPAPHYTDAEAGRLYVDVRVLAGSASIAKARWVTQDIPLRAARFDMVTPTAFNREEFLGPSVARLLSSSVLREAVARCIIINQSGTQLANHPAFAFLAHKEMAARTHIVDQNNYGSTGGYTRGAIEMLYASDTTHAVFMDDDAQIEPESVYRAWAFARFTKEPIIIGGHMFDLIRPHRLYEAANTTRLSALTVHNPLLRDGAEGVDARTRTVRDLFIEAQQSHYNAWWLCAIPRAVFERVGLPLPFFVRGDDVSLGLRAREKGIATVSLPGMAIWHEPFSMKPGGFKEYYIVRNMLINATLHGAGQALSFIPVLLARFFTHLLRFDYALAALTQRGVQDYLKGPSLLTFDGATFHQDIAGTMKAWSTARAMPQWIAPVGAAGIRPKASFKGMLQMGVRLAFNMLVPARADGHDVQAHILDAAVDLNDRWQVAVQPFANTLVASNPYAPQSYLHIRDFWKFWMLTTRMLQACLRLVLQYGHMRSKWQRGAKELSTLTFWQSYLKLGHKNLHTDTAAETQNKAA